MTLSKSKGIEISKPINCTSGCSGATTDIGAPKAKPGHKITLYPRSIASRIDLILSASDMPAGL